MKNCPRFKIVPTGLSVVLNKMTLHDSPVSDSLLDSSINQDSPIQRESRPIGRKGANAKRGSNSNNECANFLGPNCYQRRTEN
ncbi:hypothetical protein ACE6H2_018844 [Prunus campanulata]